jgi:hypothetical protein
MRHILFKHPHVLEADHDQPLYTLDSQDRFEVPLKEVEFTGYKNKQCIVELKKKGVTFDGTQWLVKHDADWDGWWVFDDILHVMWGNHDTKHHVFDGVGEYRRASRDPRGNMHDKWRILSTAGIMQLKSLAHIYGAQEHLKISKITNGREAMGDYGVVVRYDNVNCVEFVCPRCTDNHLGLDEFMGKPQDFFNCKDVVVIDPFGFTEPWVYPDAPDWPEIIAAAASFEGAGESK